MFVWLAHGSFDGKALEGRGHSPRGAAQRWIEKALSAQRWLAIAPQLAAKDRLIGADTSEQSA
jgi:hypothetical protein